MKTRDYWKQREREAKQRQATMRRLDSYNREIERIYKSTLDSIQKEIDAFYGKYAMDTGMTISEAKKRASKLDIEAYGRKAKQYVKERNFSDIANAEMKLYNMTMKVNRLELLKANIGLEMVKNFDELDKFYKDTLTNETIEELRRMSSILGDSVIDTDKANKRYSQAAERIAGASFHNATFSDRVWMHQDLLKHEIDMSLQRALISGTSMQRLASDLRKKFGVSQKNAERLMRTEIRRMQTDAAMESYKRNGNEKYEYMALGQHPCEICRALDGKVYKVEKMEVGLNAPPMHPNCMCSTAPHVDEAEYQAWQKWLDSGRTTEHWNNLSPMMRENMIARERRRLEEEKQQNKAPQALNNVEEKGKIQAREKIISANNSSKKYKTWSEDDWKAAKGKCTSAERKIIYGRFNKGYIASGEAKYINADLREGRKLNAHRQKVTDVLRDVIRKNTINEDIQVYRYVGDNAFADITGIEKWTPSLKSSKEDYWKWFNSLPSKLDPKHKYHEKAFLSVSAVDEKNVFKDRNTLLKIKVPKGTCGYVTTNKRESEILFDRPILRIEKVEVDSTKNLKIIHAIIEGNDG